MSGTTRIALIGAGGIGLHHLKHWHDVPGAAVVGVYDVSVPAARKAAKEHGVKRAYDSLGAALSDKNVDAVDICTPNMAHAAAVVAALKAGKHVLCEKPLSPLPAEIEKMIAARDKARRILMTAQHFRFDDRSRAIATLIAGGRLGDVYYTRAWWLRRRLVPAWSATFIDPALSGGGPCVDIGVHVLDLAMHLLGFPRPTSVSGIAPTKLAKRRGLFNAWGDYDRAKFAVEDFAAGLVRFENGAALTLEASWMANMTEDETYGIQLFGEEGGATWPKLDVAYEQESLLLNATARNATENNGSGYRNELRALVEAIRSGGPSPVPAEQSLCVARILDGLYQSHKTGRETRL